jgi:hypothetical protein
LSHKSLLPTRLPNSRGCAFHGLSPPLP